MHHYPPSDTVDKTIKRPRGDWDDGRMDVNPYESPEPPEEPVAFREVGGVWAGWKRIRQVGSVLAMLALAIAIVGYLSGVKFGTVPSLVLVLMLAVSLVAAVAGRAGWYFNTILNMFRGDYD